MERVKFDEIYKNHKCMVIDGSMSTALELMGLNLDSKLWTAEALIHDPELIKKVHRNYFEDGSDCGITCSYQASMKGLLENGYSKEQAKELIVKSVTLFLEARDEWWNSKKENTDRMYPLCLASVGPYGAYLADGSEYRGHYSITKEELKEFHQERMELLWNAGADLLLMETIPSLEEAMILSDLAEGLQADYWISFSCQDGKHINEGDLIQDCVRILSKDHPHLKMVGVNCTKPEYIDSLIQEIKKGTSLPIAVYPNSGEEYDPLTKSWHGKGYKKKFEEYALDYYRLGAFAVGGCCRSVDSHIQQVVLAKEQFLKEEAK